MACRTGTGFCRAWLDEDQEGDSAPLRTSPTLRSDPPLPLLPLVAGRGKPIASSRGYKKAATRNREKGGGEQTVAARELSEGSGGAPVKLGAGCWLAGSDWWHAEPHPLPTDGGISHSAPSFPPTPPLVLSKERLEEQLGSGEGWCEAVSTRRGRQGELSRVAKAAGCAVEAVLECTTGSVAYPLAPCPTTGIEERREQGGEG